MKGQSVFRNLIISWYLSEKYGLTIRAIRCAICEQPIEFGSVKVDQDIFFTCPDGHLIGSNIEPALAKERLIRLSASHFHSDLVTEHKNLQNEIQTGKKSLVDLQKWEFEHLFSNRRHFAQKHEFNNKIFELMKEFKRQFY